MTTTKPREIFINEECFECHGYGSVLYGGIEPHTQGHIACSVCRGTGYAEICCVEEKFYQAALDEIRDLKAKIEKYEEALKYYADGYIIDEESADDDCEQDKQKPWRFTSGVRARQALEGK